MSNGIVLVQWRVEPEEFEDLVGARPVDIHLVEKGELTVLVDASEGLDLLSAAGLLALKLIAGVRQYLETLLSVGLVQVVQLEISPLGHPAL